MARYILHRVGVTLPLLVAAAFLVFVAGRMAPGDPVTVRLGDQYDPVAAAVIRHELGLDQPLLVQFVRYLAAAARLDFGESFLRPGRHVGSIIRETLPVSLSLTALAIAVAGTMGITAGVVSAAKARSRVDRLLQLLILLGISIPNFVVGALLVLAVAVRMGILPVAGLSGWQSYILPVIVLAVPPTAYIMRVTRASMIQALSQEFIRTAYSKGLHSTRVIVHHALRNATLPIVTQVGLSFGYALTGAFIVEVIFAIPGMALMGVEAILQRDYSVLQAVVLVYMGIFMLVNLLVDVSYAFLNPRVRY